VRTSAAAGLAIALLSGCFFGRSEPETGPPGLPPIPVYAIATRADTAGVTVAAAPSRDPFAQITSSKRVTLTSSNADARTLLLWLAQQAEANIVIAPDVQARVSVSFRDVPVVEAMRAVVAEAGLSVLLGPSQAPWPPVVFYQLPVNVETATAEVIAARFGVSAELAKFIVESRSRLP